jgi:integrase/recombinase XerD
MLLGPDNPRQLHREIEMAGRQTKTLTKQQLAAALRRAAHSRYPDRDRVMILLSVKAGFRAGEIAKLTWPMMLAAAHPLYRARIRAPPLADGIEPDGLAPIERNARSSIEASAVEGRAAVS